MSWERVWATLHGLCYYTRWMSSVLERMAGGHSASGPRQRRRFFDHVTDPRDWQAIPYRSEMDERCGATLEQVAKPEPLLQASLRQSQCLSHDLLVSIVALLDLGLGSDAFTSDPAAQPCYQSLGRR